VGCHYGNGCHPYGVCLRVGYPYPNIWRFIIILPNKHAHLGGILHLQTTPNTIKLFDIGCIPLYPDDIPIVSPCSLHINHQPSFPHGLCHAGG
jgi:hypothetical protein